MASEMAVWVPCFNRPAYLASCLRSLAAEPEIARGEIDVFLFADGGDSRQNDCVDVAKRAGIPSLTIVRREAALGCGLNLIEAREQLYSLGYKQWLLVEDDVVVAPHYVRLMSRLWDWAARSWRNVGAVGSNESCFLALPDKRPRVALVQPCNYSWNSYLMDCGTWDLIRPFMIEFRDRFLSGRNYRERPHDAIREWVIDIVSRRPAWQPGDVPIIPGCWNGERFQKGVPFATGQDTATSASLLAAGRIKLGLQVNRVRAIGEIGLHTNPLSFRRLGLHRVKLDVFASDATLSQFTLVDRAPEWPNRPAAEATPWLARTVERVYARCRWFWYVAAEKRDALARRWRRLRDEGRRR